MIGTIRQRCGEVSYFLDGVAVTKEMYDAYFPSKLFPVESKYTKQEIEKIVRSREEADLDPELAKRLPRGYPIKSIALAVHPDQVKEAEDVAARKGVPTQFTRDGRAILRDSSHRRAYLKAHGFHDNNSYGSY